MFVKENYQNSAIYVGTDPVLFTSTSVTCHSKTSTTMVLTYSPRVVYFNFCKVSFQYIHNHGFDI